MEIQNDDGDNHDDEVIHDEDEVGGDIDDDDDDYDDVVNVVVFVRPPVYENRSLLNEFLGWFNLPIFNPQIGEKVPTQPLVLVAESQAQLRKATVLLQRQNCIDQSKHPHGVHLL